MKKLLITAVCALGVLTATAQSPANRGGKNDQRVRFGLRVGLNFANAEVKSRYAYVGGNYGSSLGSPAYNNVLDFNNRTTFHIGAIVDIPLARNFYIQPGLYLSSKGAAGKYYLSDDDRDYYETKTSPLYLEIPILASYRHDLSDFVQLQVNFGPYIAFGVGGKYEYEYDDGSDRDKDDINYFGDIEDGLAMKRFDFGLSMGAGLLFADHYYLGFTYEHGLINTWNGKEAENYNYSVKNRNWMLSLGYNF